LNWDIDKEYRPGRLWIIGRAALAVALMLVYFVLGATLGVGLCYLAYRQGSVTIIGLLCMVPGTFILVFLLPLRASFAEPGPRLDPRQQPQLFEKVNKLALLTAQPAPEEIYLTDYVNAGVGQRGGIMGLGSRRFMVIGLPLLQLLTVSQFEAVLAHEFGHFHGRDTGFLLLWLYRTRSHIALTTALLTRNPLAPVAPLSWFIGVPFKWYGQFFMRATQTVCRIQERAADRLAANIAGAQASAGALRTIHRNCDAFRDYLHDEVMPAVRRGYKPPLMEGFTLYLQSERISSRLDEFVKKELAEGRSDPDDSHPPLRERLAAIEHLPAGKAGDSSPALSLLDEPAELEARMFSAYPGLEPISWEEVGRNVVIPNLERSWKHNYHDLRDVTLDSLPSTAATLIISLNVPYIEKYNYAPGILSDALACVLLQEGWQLDHEPGNWCLRRGDAALNPSDLIKEMRSPEFLRAKWLEMLTRYQLDPAISLAPPSS